MNVAFNDQLAAASNEAEHVWHALLADRGVDSTVPVTAPGFRWLNQRWAEMKHRADLGTLGRCPHINPWSPKPVVWYAWAPHSWYCLGCPYTPEPEGAERFVCDACQHDVGENIRLAVVSVGPIIVAAGLCPACRTARPRRNRNHRSKGHRS